MLATVTGEVIFGLGTQTDNALPATGLTVLGADTTTGDFTATYSNTTVAGTTVLPALIDSGTDDYAFADTDPNMATCTATPPNNAAWVGYYCPIVAPQALSAINTGATSAAVPSVVSSPVQFAIADPNSFVATATAFINLGGGQGSARFTWGMPFFYGRKVYVGAVVVLVAAMRQGATAARQLCELVGVSLRTIARWREWWRSAFAASPFWRAREVYAGIRRRLSPKR